MNNTQLLWIIARLLVIISNVLLAQNRRIPNHEKDLEYINSVLGRELP